MEIELHNTTKIASLDDFLRDLISLFETTFPARIRSYYLGGSSSNGTAADYGSSSNSSDVDLFVIFRHIIEDAEETTFYRIVAESRLTHRIMLDAHAYSEDDLLHQSRPEATQLSFITVLIKNASLLIYGDDLSSALPQIPFTSYVLDVIESGILHLGIPYGRVTPLHPPLAYPNPEGNYYGYDIVSTRPEIPRGTRLLVAITAWIATLILALETGRSACHKSQSIQLCKEYLTNDKRTQLVAIIYDTCKIAWNYEFPENAEDHERLRTWCRDTLALENEYLRLCHIYLLTQLQHGGVEEKRQALRILQSVIYLDDEIVTTIQSLVSAKDEIIHLRAVEAVETIKLYS